MINYSIIIPHYNIPDLLARCLRSIPEREDVQVIVVDDNSPGNDTYLSQIPELSRNNVEFYITTDNMGAGHARNVGLKHAKGKWLVFSDSDDFFVENFSDLLDEYVDDNHDIIFFNIKSCDCYDISHVYEVDRLKDYRESGDELLLRICYTEPWGKMVRRKIIVDNNILFQETKAHNDLLFSIKTGLSADRIMAVDKIFYCYVIREGSLGHSKKEESFTKICDRILAWNSAQLYLESQGIRTSMYLPIRPCTKFLKNNIVTYIKLILFMRKENLNYKRAFFDTIKYTFYKLFSYSKKLSFYGMLSSKSLVKYRMGLISDMEV